MKTILAMSVGILFGLLHSWSFVLASLADDRLPNWVSRLGWTLIHSLWQLTAVALIAALIQHFLQNRSPRTRYVAAVATLVAMAVSPCITWTLSDVPRFAGRLVEDHIDERSPAAEVRPARPSQPFENAIDLNQPLTSTDQVASDTNPNLLTEESKSSFEPDVLGEFDAAGIQRTDNSRPTHSVFSGDRRDLTAWEQFVQSTRRVVEPSLPWLVLMWLVGVAVCSSRPVWGLWAQWQLRRVGLSPVSDDLQRMLLKLAQRMALKRIVRLAESARVNVPMVVGYLRPMILLPAGVLVGLTPTQLESLLAHELAHVRRHDWLVNAMQVVIETVLFYHPAVWWLSNCIRNERELCCDDIALAVIGDRASYARMLLKVEELRHTKSAIVASSIAATGGDLVHRVRRLLPAGARSERVSRGWLLGTMLLLALGILSGVSVFAVQEQSETTSQTPKRDPETVKELPDEAKNPAATETSDLEVAKQNSGTPTEPAKKSKQTTDRRRTVRVVDENKQPVAGATVRFQFEGNNTIFASLSMLDGTAKTNEMGEYSEEIPIGADRVHITVRAEGFGEFSDGQSASNGSSVVELKKGRVIRVRALNSERKLLKQAVPLLSESRIFGREFVPQPDGTFKSPPVALTRRMMRVCAAQENGPTLFSELVDVATAKPGADGVLELILTPGVRLTGRLADDVPRPISEGYVDLFIVDGVDHTFASDAFRWEDSTPVEPDGTFTFESIPGGGHAQFHVVVDGYMSVNPTSDSILDYVQSHRAASPEMLKQYGDDLKNRSHAMWPQFVPLDRPEVEVTVECEKTASCDFYIVDSAGNPISEAVVAFNPNGVTLSSGLFIPGTQSFSSAELVDNLSRGNATINIFGSKDLSPRAVRKKKEREWAEKSFLRAKSDANGLVQIRNLPGRGRESFTVTAKGHLLPRSPVYQRDGDLDDDDRRMGYVNLTSGVTNEATITLERDLKVVDREVLVIDEQGRPQSKVTVAVAEIRVGQKNWQLWSTQRFGTLPKEVTDENGRVLLKVPSLVGGERVRQLRLAVNYWNSRRDDRIWVNGAIVEAPLVADKGVIALIPNSDKSRPGSAAYGKLEELLPKQNSEQLLAVMIKQPSLAVLRQLLAATKSKQPEPIELLDEGRFSGGEAKEKVFRVSVVPAGDSKLAVVKARVRPIDGTRAGVANPSELPECAFVFDMQGQLIATLGGHIGTTGSGSPDDISVLCLGPEEDWFVRATRFQQNGTFEYQSEYYRLTNPVVNSLKYYHYANSNAWSRGPEKITRWGTLYFDFPTVKDKFDSPGYSDDGGPAQTVDGVPVLRTMTWDGDRNLFVGAAAQYGKGKPLYEVDLNFSHEFEAVAPKPNQLFVKGGAREYSHWHSWQTVVPDKFAVLLTITIPQAEGESKVIEKRLAAGKQHIQVQLKPNDDASTRLELRLNSTKPEIVELPIQLDDPPEKQPAVTYILNPEDSSRLLDRPLKLSSKALVIEIKLISDQSGENKTPKD